MTRPLTALMLLTLASLLTVWLVMEVSEPTRLKQQTSAELKLLLSN